MYKEFFQLERNPFEITPDPSFLFPTRRHNEALAALYYGVERRKGFVVLTGEVGTGKTLLVRCLLQLLHRSHIAYAYVFNSRLEGIEFLRYIAADLGLPAAGRGKGELLLLLTNFLVARYEKKQTTVLVVDEAHHCSAEVLEEIRLLTNLETSQGKLLQILLVGQPELDEKLDSHELRQLKQRVALRSQLKYLSLADTTGYIQKRLELGGAPAEIFEKAFPEETVRVVYRYSGGYPRLINTICENALINAFARQTRVVPAEIIEEVAADLRLDVAPEPTPARPQTVPPDRLVQAEQVLLELQNYLQTLRTNESAGTKPLSSIPLSGGFKPEPLKPGPVKS
jgi:general secretion pathway protein A